LIYSGQVSNSPEALKNVHNKEHFLRLGMP